MKKASDRYACSDTNVDHDLSSLKLLIGRNSEHYNWRNVVVHRESSKCGNYTRNSIATEKNGFVFLFALILFARRGPLRGSSLL